MRTSACVSLAQHRHAQNSNDSAAETGTTHLAGHVLRRRRARALLRQPAAPSHLLLQILGLPLLRLGGLLLRRVELLTRDNLAVEAERRARAAARLRRVHLLHAADAQALAEQARAEVPGRVWLHRA